MNKKVIRITESDLHNIVKESVNTILSEAYGTPPQEDLKKLNDLRLGPQNYDNSTATLINLIKNHLEDIVYETDKFGLNNVYVKKLYNLASKGFEIAQLWEKQEIIKLGQQPNFDLKHY